CQQYYNIPYNF
nr:immunoglobulin light chain junction region [Macaca mulatta]MOX87451.1 immunoglobulin light chain junction region [Macaca mulatta]MOX88565.1 immunoglobulin light chain junction region [Macaca mulatta]MOX89169.1 immunoglobulin light chain junction region [Macaca mulatta]MOX89781.1 immunoglobulin light chain junction region [Macaca mulatta]